MDTVIVYKNPFKIGIRNGFFVWFLFVTILPLYTFSLLNIITILLSIQLLVISILIQPRFKPFGNVFNSCCSNNKNN